MWKEKGKVQYSTVGVERERESTVGLEKDRESKVGEVRERRRPSCSDV